MIERERVRVCVVLDLFYIDYNLRVSCLFLKHASKNTWVGAPLVAATAKRREDEDGSLTAWTPEAQELPACMPEASQRHSHYLPLIAIHLQGLSTCNSPPNIAVLCCAVKSLPPSDCQ